MADQDGNQRPGVEYTDWYNLYRERWDKDSMEATSLSHPAKFARALIRQIYKHAMEEGWLKPGDVVLDPFGGVGLGSIDANVNGINWVGVEIEEKHAVRGGGGLCNGKPQTIEIEGKSKGNWYIEVLDSGDRKLLGDMNLSFGEYPTGLGFKNESDAIAAANTFSSESADQWPDYEYTGVGKHMVKNTIVTPTICGRSDEHDEHWIEGNIPTWRRTYGALYQDRYGQAVLLNGDSRNLVNVLRDNAERIPFLQGVSAQISSPPFLQASGGTNVTAQEGPLADKSLMDRHAAGNAAKHAYGEAEGQMGGMVEGDYEAALTSPPFTGVSSDGGWQMLGKYAEEGRLTVDQVGGDPNKSYPSWNKGRDTSYGQTPGQLADMPEGDADAAITSPVYGGISDKGGTAGLKAHGTGLTQGEAHFGEYGKTPGQLGGMDDSVSNFDTALNVNGCVSSPPYAAARIDGNGDEGSSQLRNEDGSYLRGADGWAKRKAMGGRYGDDSGNLANMKDTSFEDALNNTLDGSVRLGYNESHGTQEPTHDTGIASDGGDNRDVSGGTLVNADSRNDRGESASNSKETQEGGSDAEREGGDKPCTLDRETEISGVLEGKEATSGDGREEGSEGQRGESLSLEGRQGSSGLPQGGSQGDMRGVRESTESSDPSQEFGSLRQQTGQSGSGLRELSFEDSQTGVLGCGQGGEGAAKEQRADTLVVSDGSVSSPPFEAVLSDRPSQSIVEGGLRMGASSMGDGYGYTEGQTGNMQGDDFWMASRLILENLFVAIKPGGHAIFVLKKYVKKGQLEDFPDKWVRLAEAVGFVAVHWHYAWVVEDRGVQLDMFGGEVHKTVERKSFFRRMAEAKGSPRIDFEECVCMLRP